ncbi:hypothetical protein LRHMDP2_1577 [Lacticaseibacillus rhamnosus LRHMDP2]|uniref:Malolactic regulator n=1 Tax=Lacticaseibacillus rhamnosus LRHMDP3 TaxID=1203259 RepID=A0AB33XSU5_LACRH|nr:hypothetical protein LRHMDP3_2100 [Lacticaseibacillus rhamnosus LRHMDP3]EKS51172.1 hypothetical protein LRHMDP2_1577 [Lacticaseibacillus rhamnosus LRHMDP2]
MTKPGSLRLRALVRFYSHNALPAQESACKDLGRNDQAQVITPKATGPLLRP